ncbi:MAG: serine/threonine protein kinase [Deltaproteobacteria bacterium]|nr:serine/threonine protein kinase [Deltaproteobacteria bacterium]
MAGRVIAGKYQIVRALGEGGMGAVYEALHTKTGRRVALKVVVSEELLKHEETLRRFEREARAAGAIETQHIVQVFDAGTDPESGHPFMAMEYLSGEDLQKILERMGPLNHELALRIVTQACIGLHKAHEQGVIHRDIKPANIFLSKRDAGEMVVKILDFGIAKLKMEQLTGSGDSHALTQTGSMLGSPLYMSPEQAKGLKTIDHRTDIWSMGAVLYETLAGLPPHNADTLGMLIFKICTTTPPPIRQVAPWVPEAVASVVHQALQQDPDARFSSVSAMLDAMRPLLPSGHTLSDSMIVGAEPHRRAEAVSNYAAATDPGAAQATTGDGPSGRTGSATGGVLTRSVVKHRKPNLVPKVAAAVGIVAVLGAAAVFSLTRKPSPGAALVADTPSAPVAAPSLAFSSSAPLASVAPPSTAPAEQTVQLTIVPPSALVDVDSQTVAVVKGVVEIRGPLGSVHSVRVYAGKRETIGEVVIAEGGAVPSRIVLGTTVAKPAALASGQAGPKPGPGAPPTGTNTTKAAAPASTPTQKLETKFE